MGQAVLIDSFVCRQNVYSFNSHILLFYVKYKVVSFNKQNNFNIYGDHILRMYINQLMAHFRHGFVNELVMQNNISAFII